MNDVSDQNKVNAVLKDGQDVVVGDLLELTRDGKMKKYTLQSVIVVKTEEAKR